VFRNPFTRRDAERRPRSRAAGCLLWLLVLIVLLIVVSLLFGGFQKGTKVNGLGAAAGHAGVSSAAPWTP
jgi:hypothetical protein